SFVTSNESPGTRFARPSLSALARIGPSAHTAPAPGASDTPAFCMTPTMNSSASSRPAKRWTSALTASARALNVANMPPPRSRRFQGVKHSDACSDIEYSGDRRARRGDGSAVRGDRNGGARGGADVGGGGRRGCTAPFPWTKVGAGRRRGLEDPDLAARGDVGLPRDLVRLLLGAGAPAARGGAPATAQQAHDVPLLQRGLD